MSDNVNLSLGTNDSYEDIVTVQNNGDAIVIIEFIRSVAIFLYV